MNMRKMLLLCAAVALLSSAGCVRMATRKAGSVAFGEKSSVWVLNISDANPKEYHYVQVNPFTSDLGPKLPGTLLNDMRVGLIKQINENEDINKIYTAGDTAPGSPALVVECQILDLEKGNRLARATTVGGTAFIIARYTIKDESGNVLAVFNARGFLEGGLSGGTIEDVIRITNLGVIDYLQDKLREREKEQ